MTGREPAWWVVAHELRASTEEEKGVGERAPSYLISPMGGRLNRVLLAGTVTPGDHERRGSSSPRATLTDPTGAVALTAGSFQPHGQADLASITAPTRALVVGKVSLFRAAGTSPEATVRVEMIRPLTDPAHRSLSAEITSQSLDRLELVLRLRAPGGPSDAELARSGASPAWVRGARVSIERYPALDPAPYFQSLRTVVASLQRPSGGAVPLAGPIAATAVPILRTVHGRDAAPAPSPPPGSKALEGRLLEILDELADESPDGYADMDDLAERAARHGLHGERMEELLNFLSESGTIEEPLVGKFRRSEGPPTS